MSETPTPQDVWKIAADLRDKFGAEKVCIRVEYEDGTAVTYEAGAPNVVVFEDGP